MQQRVAIARALAYRPAVLLLDEPFASVDAQTRADLQDLLLDVWDRTRLTTVFVTHDIDEAAYMADRIVVLGAPARVTETVDVDLPAGASTTEAEMEAEAINVARDPYAALRFRDARLYVVGFISEITGSQVQTVALMWELFQRTGDPLILGWVGGVQAIPMLLLTLPAGYLADILNRKVLVVISRLGQVLSSIWLARPHNPTTWRRSSRRRRSTGSRTAPTKSRCRSPGPTARGSPSPRSTRSGAASTLSRSSTRSTTAAARTGVRPPTCNSCARRRS